jgi:hypothetical protein
MAGVLCCSLAQNVARCSHSLLLQVGLAHAFAFRPLTTAWYRLGLLRIKSGAKIANQQLSSYHNVTKLSGAKKPQFL